MRWDKPKKTRVMIITTEEKYIAIKINGIRILQVNKFNFLRPIFQNSGIVEVKINQRIKKANKEV